MNTIESFCGIPFPFIWDNVPSELYGMTIAFTDTDYNYVPSGSRATMQTDRVDDSAETFLLNEAQDQVLEFPVEIYGESMDVFKQTKIKNWLYGQRGYRKLQICIENHNTFYYNCKLVPQNDVIFDAPNGFKFTVVCDSPGAWEFPRTTIHRFPAQTPYSFTFNNTSGDMDFLYPIVSFKTTGGNTSFVLRNDSDPDGNGKPREFIFTGLQGGEEIKVNNRDKIITSSTGLLRLNNFNKRYFRLPRGVNRLTAIGTCDWLKIEYQNFLRLGGAIYQ